MSKPRIIIATAEERAAYRADRRHLYPLHGWVDAPLEDSRSELTVRCALEDLRGHWSKPDPVWELRAPDGYIFDEGTHGLLGDTQARVLERFMHIERCNCDDGCAEHWAASD